MSTLKRHMSFFLPGLFITYLGILIAFTHIHIVDGVTIVHSHPYQKENGSPVEHEHSLATFQLLHELSVIQTSGSGLFLSFVFALFLTFTLLKTFPVYPDFLTPVRGKLSLRAPPVC